MINTKINRAAKAHIHYAHLHLNGLFQHFLVLSPAGSKADQNIPNVLVSEKLTLNLAQNHSNHSINYGIRDIWATFCVIFSENSIYL